jgi:hypothetical protein
VRRRIAERARLEAEAEAALAREDKLESKWKNQEAEESEQKAARQQKLFPPVSSPLKGMPLLSDEEIPEKKRRENEDRANKRGLRRTSKRVMTDC